MMGNSPQSRCGLVKCHVVALTVLMLLSNTVPTLGGAPIASLDAYMLQAFEGTTASGSVQIGSPTNWGAPGAITYNGNLGITATPSPRIGLQSFTVDNTIPLGEFGGAGVVFWGDVGVAPQLDFDPNIFELEVVYKTLGGNTATNFQVIIDDEDPGFAGDRHIYNFTGFDSVIPDPDGWSRITRDLASPADSVLQGPGTFFAGDTILNPDLYKFSVVQDSSVANTLNVEIQSVHLQRKNDDAVLRLDTFTYRENSVGPSLLDNEFDSFSTTTNPGAVTTTHSPTGGQITIDAQGFGFLRTRTPLTEVDPSQYAVRVNGSVTPGNTSEFFNVVVQELDGDDTVPGSGGDFLNYRVDLTSGSDFADTGSVTIPLNQWFDMTDPNMTPPAIETTYGGDGSPGSSVLGGNSAIAWLQITAADNDLDGGADPNSDHLMIVIDSVEIVPLPAGTPGDFNSDGRVDGLDFLEWQRNPGVGLLSDWEANYGSPLNAAVSSVPEPTSVVLVLCSTLSIIALRVRTRRTV